MGTRWVMSFYEKKNGKKELVGRIYGQCDGYPDGYPMFVMSLLAERQMTNGIPLGKVFEVINGPDDLVTQVITLLKLVTALNRLKFMGTKEIRIKDYEDAFKYVAAGTIYACPWKPEDLCIDYRYDIIAELPRNNPTDIIDIITGSYNIKVKVYKARYDSVNDKTKFTKIFEGTPKEYIERFKE